MSLKCIKIFILQEVFFIKDCVIEKTGLPAKNVSAEVLGAYKVKSSFFKVLMMSFSVTRLSIFQSLIKLISVYFLNIATPEFRIMPKSHLRFWEAINT